MPAIDPRIFPTLLVVLDLCASAAYAFDSDWRRVAYWAAAATLTACVTY